MSASRTVLDRFVLDIEIPRVGSVSAKSMRVPTLMQQEKPLLTLQPESLWRQLDIGIYYKYVSSPTYLFQLNAAAEIKEIMSARQTNAW